MSETQENSTLAKESHAIENKPSLYLNQDKETGNIQEVSSTFQGYVFRQIRILVASATEENLFETQKHISLLLQRGSWSLYIDYWKLLVRLFSKDIEEANEIRRLSEDKEKLADFKKPNI